MVSRIRNWTQKSTWTLWVTLLLAVAVLALLGFVGVKDWRRPDEGFSWTLDNRVIELDRTGPAASAGLQMGDTILEMDGVQMDVASYGYGAKAPGDVVTLTVLRDERSLTIPVVLRRPPHRVLLRRLEPLLIAASFWLVSTVSALLGRGTKRSTMFLLCSQVGASALAAGVLSSHNASWGIRLFNVLLCALAPLLTHFHLIFPTPRCVSRCRLLLSGLYGVALVLVSPYLLVDPMRFKTLSWYSAWRGGVRAFLAMSLLASVALLLGAYLVDAEMQVRRRIRVVVMGTAVAFAPVALLSILPEAVGGAPLVAYELTFLGLVLVPVAYAVAIYKYDLLGIDRVINRSIVHLALAVLWVGLYLLLAWMAETLLPNVDATHLLSGALTALVMAVTLGSVRQHVQSWVDRLFYGSWYDYRSVVTSVGTELSEAQDEAALVKQLVHRLTSVMRLRGIALFLADGPGDLVLQASTGLGLCSADDVRLPSSGPLVRLLRQRPRAMRTVEMLRGLDGEELSSEERAWTEKDDVELWLPLVHNEHLRGVLVLGAKRAEDSFGREDLQILATLSHQAGLASENVALLRSLRRRVEELTVLREELELMHRRVLSSREEERNRLARELHDRVLQEVLALNIGLRSAFRLSKEAPIIERLSEARDALLSIADEIRRICAELRPPALTIMGLADAIRSYTEAQAVHWGDVAVSGGFSSTSWPCQPELTIALDLDEDRKRLEDDVAIALFRVYQETLSNVRRHAAAKHVWVRERLTEGTICLSIRDDGCGFAVPVHPGYLSRQGHFGLLGAHERVADVGGNMRVESQPGMGTSVAITAPLTRPGRDEYEPN
jgi:signal transduction histidine kinase